MTTARLAPRGRGPPPDLRRDAEAGEEVQQEDARTRGRVSQRESRVYSLAKKNTGMKVIMAINKTRFSMANGLMRKIFDLDQRRLRRRCPFHGHEDADDDQPGENADPRPRITPSPRDRLLQAEDAQADAGGDEHRAQVIDRVSLVLRLGLRHGDEQQGDQGNRNVDPEDGPPGPLGEVAAEGLADSAESPPAIPKNSASAFPRSRSGNVLTTMASAAGNMSVPSAPWMTRKVTIQASAPEPLGVSRTWPRRRRRR